MECVTCEVCGVCYMRSLWSVLHEQFVECGMCYMMSLWGVLHEEFVECVT